MKNPRPSNLSFLLRGSRAGAFAPTVLASLLLSMLCVPFFCGESKAQAQPEGDPAILQVQELQTALKKAMEKIAEAEIEVAKLKEGHKELAASLAQANTESETNREAYRDAILRMDALGLEALNPSEKGLQQRLLKAVRDRDLSNQEVEKIAESLMRLSEAAMAYLQAPESARPTAQETLQGELQRANEALGLAGPKPQTAPRSLAESQVVSLDQEIGLIVLNAGKGSGVRVGMPVEIRRDNTSIGAALVVDVRDSVCGALLQEIFVKGEDVKVGDQVRPRAQQL